MTALRAGSVLSVAGWVLSAACLVGCATQPAPSAAAPAVQPKGPSVRAKLEQACGRLAAALGGKLAKDKSVAVLPLADSHGGVTRLGVVIARGVERRLLAAGTRVVDRANVNALLAEKKFQLAMASDGKMLAEAARVAKADVLVVGTLVPAAPDVLASVRAVDVKTGKVLAAGEEVSLPAADLGELMWYVRRPTAAGPAGDLPPLALRYEFVSPYGRAETRLADGSTVRSRQRFKIRVQPNSDCYLYVLLYDSSGRASVLFPHRKIHLGNEVRGGVSYEVPEAAKWYWFDDVPGTETFYLVASYTPLHGLDRILAKMERAAGQKVQLAHAARERIEKIITRGVSAKTSEDYRPKGFTIKVRGVGGIVDAGGDDGATTDTHRIDSVVQGHATAVKKITLRHR